jgi:hypothetical protein
MTHGKNDVRDSQIAAIRAACVEANPTRAEVWNYNTGAPIGSGSMASSPCRLADVLLAIETEKRRGLNSPDLKRTSEFLEAQKLVDSWSHRTDNLTAQSDGCIEFLADFLK